MNLKLNRTDFREDGIFGQLLDEADGEVAVTLEHSYDSGLGDGSYAPKLPPGTYQCVRGQHQLHSGPPFITFEITNVPGHTNILLHVGNYNEDSEGCVLLGRRVLDDGMGKRMITSSRNTFNKFMDLQNNCNEFTLTVTNEGK